MSILIRTPSTPMLWLRCLCVCRRARGAEEVGAQEHQLTEGELEGVTGVSHEGTHPGAPEGEGDGEEPVVWRGERTVDEIIADLRQIQQQQINMLDFTSLSGMFATVN